MMAACNNGAGGGYPKTVMKPVSSFNALRIIKKMIHIPILRAGRSYRSLNTVRVPHIKTGEPLVEVSQANRGLIAKDLLDIALQKEVLGQRFCRRINLHLQESSASLRNRDIAA